MGCKMLNWDVRNSKRVVGHTCELWLDKVHGE